MRKLFLIGLLAIVAMIGSVNAQAAQANKGSIIATGLDANALPIKISQENGEENGRLGDTLLPGQSLYPGQSLISPNSQFELVMQRDGNLVLYRTATGYALWASGTNGQDVIRLDMQGDGNLVIYLYGGRAAWASGTWGRPGSYLVVQDDGNVVIYQPRVPIWATNTP